MLSFVDMEQVVDLDNKSEVEICTLESIGLEGHVGSAVTHHSGRLFFSVIQTGIIHTV